MSKIQFPILSSLFLGWNVTRMWFWQVWCDSLFYQLHDGTLSAALTLYIILYYNLCTIVRLVNVIHTPTPTETSVLLCIWLTGMITEKHKSLGRKRGGKLVCFSQWNVNNVDETSVTSQWRTQAKYFRRLFLLPSLDL